jgi:S-adenosylmethionine-diacylglycerol 3-amino-3-carboxypropyl transferase
MEGLPSWVSEAARFPVAFAQVREDSLLDLSIVERLPQGARVILVASGGCTAALLATAPNVALLHLVDPNAAQLALSQLKLHLLRTTAPDERAALLGHHSMEVAERRSVLARELRRAGLSQTSLGSLDIVASLGPDHAGRYERLFAALREELAVVSGDVARLLELSDTAEQERRIDASSALGHRIDSALNAVMALANLVALFGEDATNNRAQPFPQHFAERLRNVLALLPASSNPYLWQVLVGRYPACTRAPWLDEPIHPAIPVIRVSNTPILAVLEREADGYDFVHLSNVLDWLTPARAVQTLSAAYSALRPGGYVFIRQLNSTLDVRKLGCFFEWLEDEAHQLHSRDRSFFYRTVHLGIKR